MKAHCVIGKSFIRQLQCARHAMLSATEEVDQLLADMCQVAQVYMLYTYIGSCTDPLGFE